MIVRVVYLIRDLHVVPFYLFILVVNSLDSNVTRVSPFVMYKNEAVEGSLEMELRGGCEQHKVVKGRSLRSC